MSIRELPIKHCKELLKFQKLPNKGRERISRIKKHKQLIQVLWASNEIIIITVIIINSIELLCGHS